MQIDTSEMADLGTAKRLLESQGLAIKLTNLIGYPIEKGIEKLPDGFQDKVVGLTSSALDKALGAALFTMDPSSKSSASNLTHSVLATLSGAVGGAFGLPALALELPVSTTIMLRSIADIARSEGEDISDPETKAACLEVFALGGKGEKDDGAETGYFVIRSSLARSVTTAANHVAERGLATKGAPAIVAMISKVAQRFSVQVTEKAAAQLVPAVGALGGGAVNAMFIDHFQDMARGHFIVRRLERKYTPEHIRQLYADINVG